MRPEVPWLQFVPAFGVLLALIIAVGNGLWQSYLLNVKLRHDLFEKRFEVYRSFRNFVHKLMSDGSVGTPDVQALTKHALAVEFLFNLQVVTFMDEVYRKAADLSTMSELEKKGEIGDSQRTTYQNIRTWFSREATAQVESLFSPDLNLYKPCFVRNKMLRLKTIFKCCRFHAS